MTGMVMEGAALVSPILLIIEHLSIIVDQGYCVDTIYLDFLMAFNTVQYQHLISKMNKYNFISVLLTGYHHFLHLLAKELW